MVGEEFIIIFRLSMIELVEDGANWEEVIYTAKELEKVGVNIINTGIGWHEARIPTIATMVPRGAFTWVTGRLKQEVNVPLVSTNRINGPQKAEEILANGESDLISMARPFLADAEIIKKSEEGREEEINTCIACNQACLDRIFNQKVATCLVNPMACNETMYQLNPVNSNWKLAIVGAGPAGLSAAVTGAQRGFEVTLFEARNQIGGQFNLARKIPGKEEFSETLRYFKAMIKKHGIKLKLNYEVDVEELSHFDQVILASGVYPRKLGIKGENLPHVIPYNKAIENPDVLGTRIAVIGAGGIGVDVSTMLLHPSSINEKEYFNKYWGITKDPEIRGNISKGEQVTSNREIFIFKRSEGKLAHGTGKTTAWIHRRYLKLAGVNYLAGLKYKEINEKGILIEKDGLERLIECDHIVVCAGQESNTSLLHSLNEQQINYKIIGGAKNARGINAFRAIKDGLEAILEL